MQNEILLLSFPPSYVEYFKKRNRFNQQVLKSGTKPIVDASLSDIYNMEGELNPQIKRFKKLLTTIHNRETLGRWLEKNTYRFSDPPSFTGYKYDSGGPSNEAQDLTPGDQAANDVLDSADNFDDQAVLDEFMDSMKDFFDDFEDGFDKLIDEILHDKDLFGGSG